MANILEKEIIFVRSYGMVSKENFFTGNNFYRFVLTSQEAESESFQTIC